MRGDVKLGAGRNKYTSVDFSRCENGVLQILILILIFNFGGFKKSVTNFYCVQKIFSCNSWFFTQINYSTNIITGKILKIQILPNNNTCGAKSQ